MSEAIYLMFDKTEPECLEAERYLTEKKIHFGKVPCSGMVEAELVVGQNTFRGIKKIKEISDLLKD